MLAGALATKNNRRWCFSVNDLIGVLGIIGVLAFFHTGDTKPGSQGRLEQLSMVDISDIFHRSLAI